MKQSAEDIFLENLENDIKTTFLRNILKFNSLANHVSFKLLNDADLDKREEFVRTELTELVEKDEYESYFAPFHKKLLNSIEINAHSLIKLIQKYRDDKQFSQMEHFNSWLFSSRPCQQVFRSTRSMTSTFSTIVNFSLQDIMNRLHKIEVLVNTVNDLSDKFILPRESGGRMGVAVGDELQSQKDYTTEDTFLVRVDEISEDLEKSTPEDQENVPEDLLNMELTGFDEQLNMKDQCWESIRPPEPPHPFKMPVNILPECYNAVYYSLGGLLDEF
ncbi:hypothetical protein FQR65_LT13299 [Abscondita terminalis]|nr:hypothetical protein FQR65_LT13299 [Abscondita terminalis]